MLNNKYNAYNNHIATNLTSGQQVAAIYEKIISLIQKSKGYIVDGKAEKRFSNLNIAQEIVENMSMILDNNQEVSLITVLKDFYLDLYCNISELHFTHSIENYDKVILKIKSVSDEWRKIL